MILACGEALIDMVMEDDGCFKARAGGSPFNTAIAMGRLGTQVGFVGKIGTDFLGQMLYEKLSANNVDTALVTRADLPTTLAFAQKDAHGDVHYAFYSNGAADRSLEEKDLPAQIGKNISFIVLGSISIVQEPIASTLEKLVSVLPQSSALSIDPNIRPALIKDRKTYLDRFLRILGKAALVKTSSEDLEWLFPEIAAELRLEHLLNYGPSLIVETRGAEGARAVNARCTVTVPAYAIKVADTIGAGDTFHAALLFMLERQGHCHREQLARLSEEQLTEALQCALSAAAINCTRIGADPPTYKELQAFLAERR